MKFDFRLSVCLLLSFASIPVLAAPIDDEMDRFAAEAVAADASFAGFSAERGEQLYGKRFASGKADTPACTTCHGDDPTRPGKTLTGKRIEPMAVSAAAQRYADSAKVAKWFKRNCVEVLGRECTALEKGDWLAYIKSR